MLKPLLDRVLLKKVEEKKVTSSGLLIAEKNKEIPYVGEVIAVGPGRLDENGNRVKMEVTEGHTVIFKQYTATEIEHNQEKFVIVEMKDILAIVEKDEE